MPGKMKRTDGCFLSEEKKGIKKLNILVGTHPDSDHVGGLDDVINNVRVDTVYLPEVKNRRKRTGMWKVP